MSFNYKIIEEKNLFTVFEKTTDQVIRSFGDIKEAKAFLRHLNLGGGFDGWTPSFFLKPFEIKMEND